jgi:hypothetical protein
MHPALTSSQVKALLESDYIAMDRQDTGWAKVTSASASINKLPVRRDTLLMGSHLGIRPFPRIKTIPGKARCKQP